MDGQINFTATEMAGSPYLQPLPGSEAVFLPGPPPPPPPGGEAGQQPGPIQPDLPGVLHPQVMVDGKVGPGAPGPAGKKAGKASKKTKQLQQQIHHQQTAQELQESLEKQADLFASAAAQLDPNTGLPLDPAYGPFAAAAAAGAGFPNPGPSVPGAAVGAGPPPGAPGAVDLDSETESNHDTALTLACAGGHEELVKLLLSRGADIGKKIYTII